MHQGKWESDQHRSAVSAAVLSMSMVDNDLWKCLGFLLEVVAEKKTWKENNEKRLWDEVAFPSP